MVRVVPIDPDESGEDGLGPDKAWKELKVPSGASTNAPPSLLSERAGGTRSFLGEESSGESGGGRHGGGGCATLAEKCEQVADKARLEHEKMIQERLMTDKMGFSAKVRPKRSGSGGLSLEAPPGPGHLQFLRWHALSLLSSQRFDMSIGFVILANSISIGVESSFDLQGKDLGAFEKMEHVFLAVYSLELFLRFFAQGLNCLRSGWVIFDLVLVGMGVISTWVVTPIMGKGAMADELGPLMVLRVMRLLRLARAVRLLVQFKTLWMLVRGLLSSAGTMIYTFSLIALILYVYACLGMELITKNPLALEDESFREAVEDHFSSIPHSMLTLTQFVTLDSAASIYKPLIRKDPFMLTAYFMSFILVVAVSLMNLVTAVIVEGALEQGKADREVQQAYELAKVKELLPRVQELFRALDVDRSGDITLEEVLGADQGVTDELQEIMKSDQLTEVFELLDVDGSGKVDVTEFCDGIAKVVSTKEPVEFIRMMKQLKQQRAAQQNMSVRMETLERTVSNVAGKVDLIAMHLLGKHAAVEAQAAGSSVVAAAPTLT